MNQNISKVTTAAEASTVLATAIRRAHGSAESVMLSNTLLDLIGEAALLENKLKRLQYALMEDARQAGEAVSNLELLPALKNTLAELHAVTQNSSTAKSMLSLDHPAQNILSYDIEAVDNQARAAIALAEKSEA